MLILSFHCAEEEYVLTIAENQKKFYHALIDSGVDVLWINHPHVAKEWELISYDGVPRKIIFYAMGNTISGQRRNPEFSNPANRREYTGDGYVSQVAFEKDSGGAKISWVNPVLVTTLITDEKYFVIKKLNDEFLNTLEETSKWKPYLSERKRLMEQIKGKIGILFVMFLIVVAIAFVCGFVPFIGSIASFIIIPAFSLSLLGLYPKNCTLIIS